MAQTQIATTSTQPQSPAVAVSPSPVFSRLRDAGQRFPFGSLRARSNTHNASSPVQNGSGGGGESSTAGASGSRSGGINNGGASTSKSKSKKQYTDENDDEWYIPYNGPIEGPPKGKEGIGVGGGEGRVRDSWGDVLDVGVNGSGSGQGQGQGSGAGGASSRSVVTSSGEEHGTGHGHQPHAHFQQQATERERDRDGKHSRGRTRTRDRAASAASRYTDGGTSVLSAGMMSPKSANTMGPGTSHGRLPVPSFLTLDGNATGIGESPVPVQRGGGGGGGGGGHGHGLGWIGHGGDNANATNERKDEGTVGTFAPDLPEFGQGSSATREGQHVHAGKTATANHAHTPSQGTNVGNASFVSSATSTHYTNHKERERERERTSFASFWTFGGNKKSPTTHAAHMTRPSVETFWSRPSTSTHGGIVGSPLSPSGAGGGVSAVPTLSRAGANGTRERAATIDDRYNVAGQPVLSVDVHAPAMSSRPRANTSGGQTAGMSPQESRGPSPSQREEQEERYLHQQQAQQQLERQSASPTSGAGSPRTSPVNDPPSAASDETDSPYLRIPHPYAVAFPNKGHREHSRLLQPIRSLMGEKRPSSRGELPTLALPSRFSNTSSTNGIPPQLQRQPSKLIKPSLSTPNLRAPSLRQGLFGRVNGGSQPNSSGFGNKWLSAETWCDALIFPRPRFKVRAAHVITPPDSPSQERFLNDGPHSAPLQGDEKHGMGQMHIPRVLRKSQPREKEAKEATSWIKSPTSAPPQFASPAPPENKPTRILRPPRPKSFAQDDLALPSPVPSLTTVLREGAQLQKERDTWKHEATKSFGNKRSRSLSRSRMRAMPYRRKDSQDDLATNFDMLAARAVLGSQAAHPSVSAPGTASSKSATTRTGTNTMSFGTSSSHSRKSSGVSQPHSRTHSRKESWGKTVVKTAKTTANATGLCAFNTDALNSPVDDKARAMDVAISRQNTKYLKASDQSEKRDNGEGGVLLIGPHARPSKSHAPEHRRVAIAPSPTPSAQTHSSTSHTGVGVAISTPVLQATDPNDRVHLVDHPYASVSNRQSDDVPRSSDYAGPHPTSAKLIDLQLNGESMNEMSLRHRLPPVASRLYAANMLHPYANVSEARPKPTLQMPIIQASDLESRMFAQRGVGPVGEIQPDEIQYSPYSQPSPSKAASSNYSMDALGVEEALNVAFKREKSQGDDRGEARTAVSDVVHAEQEEFDYQKLAPLQSSSSRIAVLPRQGSDDRDSWQIPSNIAVLRANFTKESSSGQMSIDSSPMTSPRHFVPTEDVDEYNDLFYRPGRQSNDEYRRTPSSEIMKNIISRETSGGGDASLKSPPTSSEGSALQKLTRQLSEEYGSRLDDEHTFGPQDSAAFRDSEDVARDIIEEHRHVSVSPPGAALPLRMQASRPMSFSASPLIPEDVESSRASSILERSEDPHDGTVIFQRVGEVGPLATPDPTAIQNGTSSARGSFIDNAPATTRGSEDNNRQSQDNERTPRRPSRPSLTVPNSASEGTRASYVTTSTSDASRISQLSDFPIPPHLDTMTPSYMVQSFYEEIDRDTINTIRTRPHAERRTTFGIETDLPPFESDTH